MNINTDLLLTGLFGIATSILSFLFGRRERNAKATRDDMSTVEAAQKLIAPLLASGEELSQKILVIRREKEEMEHKLNERINELEMSVQNFVRAAERCTCGALKE